MNFKKYSSIENSYRTKTVHHMQIEHPKADYAVTEKVHGSNFSIYVNDGEVKYAKRSGFIKEGENFYNHTSLSFPALESCKEDLVFAGELYGGNYPHEDVEQVDTKAVQKGVYYSPGLNFVCFDVKENDEWVSFDRYTELCALYDIPYLEALKVGTLEECLEYSNKFPTTIPEDLHGLPSLDNNFCEGIVIKPLHPLYLSNGDRVVLKNKNEDFSEKKAKGPLVVTPLEPHVEEMLEEAGRYVTENRLRNVLSKIGAVTSKDFGKIMGLMSKDIVEDFMKDNEEFAMLETKDRKVITKAINRMASNLIRVNFLNIIDGDF